MATTRKTLQAEVQAETTAATFTYDGVEYTVPAAKDWPLTVIRAQENGKMLAAIEALLGDKQWAKFESTPRTMGDFEKLVEALFDATDLDPKE